MNRREFSAGVVGGLLSSPFVDSLGRLGGVPLPAPRVDGARLNRHLAELSQFGANPQGGVTRLAYSDADKQAREYVLGLMRDAKLTPTIDAAGNIIASRPGRDSARTPITTDSTAALMRGADAGAYDHAAIAICAANVSEARAAALRRTRGVCLGREWV